MILRLLLLFSLSSPGSSIKYSIEKARCTTDTACYIRESCLNKTGTDDAKLVQYKDESLKDDLCDVFLQIQSFATDKHLVMLQVKSSTGTITGSEVAFKQTKVQFRCKDGKEDTENTNLDVVAVGDRQPVKPNFLFCSFILRSKDGTWMFQYNTASPEIVFTTDQPNIIRYDGKQQVFWFELMTVNTCDPDFITTSGSFNESHFLEPVDNTRAPIVCSLPATLQIEKNGVVDFSDSLMCLRRTWAYDIINGERIEISVVNDAMVKETAKVACVTKRCALCPPLEDFPCGAGCTKANYTNITGSCATSTCHNNLWRVSDGNPIPGQMECKHKENAQNLRESVWYIGKDVISKASCAEDADCLDPNISGVTVVKDSALCPTDKSCSVVEISDKKDAFCKDAKYQLTRRTSGKDFNETMLNCSTIKGLYSDANGIEIPKDSIIFCELRVEASTEPPVSAAAASVSPGLIAGVGGGIIVCLLIAGGVSFVLFTVKRRRKQYEKWVVEEKARQKARALADAIIQAPIERKPMRDDLTAWERRPLKNMPASEKPDQEMLYNWTNENFINDIAQQFMKYSFTNRMIVLSNLTAFDAYGLGDRKQLKKRVIPQFGNIVILDTKPKQVHSDDFGNLIQFFYLWQFCANHLLDCHVSWEYMWRFMKMLYENFITHDDKREIGKKMVKLVVGFARPMLTEFTYKIKMNEDSIDTWMRFLVIRMLLWAEAPDVVAEIARLADQPYDQLESPLRAIVFQYAVRHLGRAATFKEKYWEAVQGDSHVDNPLFGSIRQHILYALCTARDETKKNTESEFKVMRETITTIFNYNSTKLAHSFSPGDQYWAMRGASEYVTNMKPAVDTYIAAVPQDVYDELERHVMARCKNGAAWNREAAAAMTKDWKLEIVQLVNTVSEMCMLKTQAEAVVTTSKGLLQFVREEKRKSARELEAKEKRLGEQRDALRKEKREAEGENEPSEPKKKKKGSKSDPPKSSGPKEDEDKKYGFREDDNTSDRKRKMKKVQKAEDLAEFLGPPIPGLPLPQLQERAANFYNVIADRKVADMFNDALEYKGSMANPYLNPS